MKIYQKIMLWIGGIAIVMGVIAWGISSYKPKTVEEIELKPVKLNLLGEEGEGINLVPPQLRLTIPDRILAGDSGLLSLQIIHPEDQGIGGSNESGSDVVISLAEFEESWHVVYEARLDIAPVMTRPDGVLFGTIAGQDRIHFEWEVFPGGEGDYEGILWIFLDMVDRGNGESNQQAVLARSINLHVTPLWGMDKADWQTISTVFMTGGLLIGAMAWFIHHKMR